MRILETVYIAGFFDGEGCVGIYPIGNTFRLIVQITNTELNILDILKEMYGGGVYKMKKKKDEHTQAFIWKIASNEARDFLLDIVDHLIIKKEQATLAIKFQDIKWGDIESRRVSYKSIKLLKSSN